MGTVAQRTGLDAPAALTRRKALRLLKVESAKPWDGGLCLMTAMARTVSGWAAMNALTLAGSGFPVAGSGMEARTSSRKPCAEFTPNTASLFIVFRHSPAPGSRNLTAMLRTMLADRTGTGWRRRGRIGRRWRCGPA